MNVVRLRPASHDQVVAHEQRERQIREPVPVQVTELAASMSKLRSAKSMTADRHARPRRDLPNDRFVDGFFGHRSPQPSALSPQPFTAPPPDGKHLEVPASA